MISKDLVTKELYVAAFSSAENLGTLTDQELRFACKACAHICLIAADELMKVLEGDFEDDF